MLNQANKVSIIMPTYNRANYIIETIESIRNQTYTNWELVIVDDGSDDNTKELVTKIKDNRIEFYEAGRINKNGKIKNIGIAKAEGVLIAFMDSDDLWPPDKIEKQVSALMQYPEAGFALTNGYNFRVPYVPIEYFYKPRSGLECSYAFHSFFNSDIAGFIQCLMMWRNCLDVCGKFNEIENFSDVEFIVKLLYRFKVVVLYEPLHFRRLHDSNHSASNNSGFYSGIEIINFYKNINALPLKLGNDALFRAYMNFGEENIKHKKWSVGIMSFFRAWRYKPLSISPFKKTVKTIFNLFK